MMFKLIRRAITFILTLAIAIPGYAIVVTWNAAHHPTIRSGDVIVVPGAAQLNGTPGEVLLARLQEAKRIYQLGLAPLIITVGSGAPGDRTTEAASGAYWLRTHGIKRNSKISHILLMSPRSLVAAQAMVVHPLSQMDGSKTQMRWFISKLKICSLVDDV